jgi:hypothetical protein
VETRAVAGRNNNITLKLPEAQALIACIIDSLHSNKERSNEELKSINSAGKKLRILEKQLQHRSQKHGRI